MDGIEGTKLEKKEPGSDDPKYYIVIWDLDEPGQHIFCKDEEECDRTLKDIAEGKGILLLYEWLTKEVRIFPRRAIKIEVKEEYRLSWKDLDAIRKKHTLHYEMKVPNDFTSYYLGNNHYNPTLVRKT